MEESLGRCFVESVRVVRVNFWIGSDTGVQNGKKKREETNLKGIKQIDFK